MGPGMKSACVGLLIHLMAVVASYCQENQENLTFLNFKDAGKGVENVILLNIPEMDYRLLHYTTGEKAIIEAMAYIVLWLYYFSHRRCEKQK